MFYPLVWLLLISSCLICYTNAKALTPIEHVIVLMLENRSLDHMLGFLKSLLSDFNGCLPNETGCSNPIDPSDPSSSTVTVDNTAVYQQSSPDHSIKGTTFEIYGSQDDSGDPQMNGFIKEYADRSDSADDGASIMKCFAPEHVPVLANLSMEFALFDGWFASVPGPTMPNRAFAASSTSNGMGTNDVETIIRGMPQKTMFTQLLEMGLDYRVYFQEIPAVLQFKDMRHKEARQRYSRYENIFTDLSDGNMPEFTWVEPRYYDAPGGPATDQHPDHDVSAGEALIEDLYNAVRSSPLWNTTAFVITYDEHGGFFDHVAPPSEGVPSPDGISSVDDPFDFTRLGVRVPTVVVSPWVERGVIHAPTDSEGGHYEHSSIISTVVHKMFESDNASAPQPSYLTARDEWAKSFEGIFTTLDKPRTDCPLLAAQALDHRAAFPNSLPSLDGQSRVTDLQIELAAVAAGAAGDVNFDAATAATWTELQAADFVKARMNIFLERDD